MYDDIVMSCDHCGQMWMGPSIVKNFPKFGQCFRCGHEMRELRPPVPSLAQLAQLPQTSLLRMAIMVVARSRDALDRVDQRFQEGSSRTALLLDIARKRLEDRTTRYSSELEGLKRELIMYTHVAQDVQAQAVGNALLSLCLGLLQGVFPSAETTQNIIRYALFSQRFEQFHVKHALMDAAYFSTSKPDVEAQFEAFISHASEDKDAVVRPLVRALEGCDLKIWYDEYQREFEDNDPHPVILQGLALSAVGVVVLSHRFLAKTWPRFELENLLADEAEFKKPVLLVSHGLTKSDVRQYSPLIAEKGWIDISADGVDRTARRLVQEIRGYCNVL